MSTESEGPQTLLRFIRFRGAMSCLRNDNSKMQTSNAWNDILDQYSIKSETTEPHHPHQNQVERRIQVVKNKSRALMDYTGCPPQLWLYCVYYVCDLLNYTAHKSLGWRTPYEKAFGQSPGISPYLYFTFFEAIYYYDNDSYPETKEKLGYWLGVTQNCGDAFTYYVYKS